MPFVMRYRPDRDPGLDILIDRVGKLSPIAAACGISRPAVSRWKRVPVEHALAIMRRSYPYPVDEMQHYLRCVAAHCRLFPVHAS